jgi:predicted alpha/beta-hydrolase family hydrolase
MKQPLIVFAPGAGAPSTSDWMRDWARRLGELGTVVPFDYRYQLEGRRRPDLLPALVARHQEAIEDARARHPGRPLVLAGKSMGSRVGCHVALEQEEPGVGGVDALICFGYPLQAAGSGKLRDEVLLGLRTRVLFLQGTKDPLCPLSLLEPVRAKMTARNELYTVEGGDHSLRVSKRLPQEPVDEAVLGAVRRFLEAA